MKPRFLSPSLTLLASALSLSAFAQAPIQSLDQVVVTPARLPQLEQDVVGDFTVISQTEISRAGQSSVAEILARQPGLEFYNNGGPQTGTGVSIRGAGFNHTLVLINGMRINSSIIGGTNWNAINPASIERIEIIRGAASSLYGSDAIGGVINIITKQGGPNQEPELYGSIGYGTYRTFKSDLGVQGSHEGLHYGLNASYSRSTGFNATNKNAPFGIYHPDNDGYHDHSFSGSLAYDFNADHSLGATFFNSYINGDFDNGIIDWQGADASEAFTQTRQQNYTVYSRNRLTEHWHSTVEFGLSKETGVTPAFDGEFSTLQRQYRWQNDWDLSSNQQLSFIVERLEERITHNANYEGNDRNTNSVAAIYRIQLGAHSVQASLRNDHLSQYGNRMTGGLGYDYAINSNWTTGAAFNTGFHAPSFSNLYYPGFSNPHLKPEKSRNAEVFLGYATAQSQAKITLYQNKIRDLINSSPHTNYLPDNIDNATIRGLTVFGSHDFGQFNLWASADFANPKDDATGRQLIRRAKRQYKAGAQYDWHAFVFGAEYQYVGPRFNDALNSESTRMGGFSLVNLTSEYRINKSLKAQVRWNNIFNRDYANNYGYNMPGSNVFLNFAWRL